MARRNRYSQEVRERVVRMVFEHRGEYGSDELTNASKVLNAHVSLQSDPVAVRLGGPHAIDDR
jgi:transposase-like protein